MFIVHGEDSVATAFTETLKIEYGQRAVAPYSGSEFDLAAGRFTYEAGPVPKAKKSAAGRVASGVYARLVAAGQRLMAIIKGMDGYPNKDVGRLADQITALCEKYDDRK